jgi:hypothetical protein
MIRTEINADVLHVLQRHSNLVAVAMSMEVKGSVTILVPGLKRKMAQDNECSMTLELYLDLMISTKDSSPLISELLMLHVTNIMVACNKNLLTV